MIAPPVSLLFGGRTRTTTFTLSAISQVLLNGIFALMEHKFLIRVSIFGDLRCVVEKCTVVAC